MPPAKDTQRQLLEYLDVLKSLPPPKVQRIVLPHDALFLTCACGVRQPRREMPKRDSGVVRFDDTVCRGCARQGRAWATVVCAKCREVVGKLEPFQDPKDRFTFTPGAIYHVLYCDVCTPGLQASEVIERIIWRRNNNLPNPIKSA